MSQDRGASTRNSDAAPCANPVHISAEIDAALHRSRDGPSTICVSAEGGVVTLTGTVRTEDQRALAAHTAARSPGTTDVQNHLQVD